MLPVVLQNLIGESTPDCGRFSLHRSLRFGHSQSQKRTNYPLHLGVDKKDHADLEIQVHYADGDFNSSYIRVIVLSIPRFHNMAEKYFL